MVLGDVGRYPIETEAECRIWGFWYGLCNTSHSKSPKVCNLMFQLCSKLYYACEYKLPWLMKVHSLLDSLGLFYIWSNQVHSIESFKPIGWFSEAGLHEWMPFVIFRARSRETSQRHFRADFWVSVASRCVQEWKVNLELRSCTNATTAAAAKITRERGWRVETKVSLGRFLHD